MTERNGIKGCDFSMSVVKAWEEAFFSTEIPGTRKIALRTSIVLGDQGGAYPKLKQITRLGLGGQQGDGHQMVSWIHISDFCRAVEHIINTRHLEGAINVTGPEPLTNKDFMAGMRKINRPLFFLNSPKWLLELGASIVGTETELLLKSRYVVPDRLLKSGFEFEFNNMAALYSLKKS